MLLAAAVLLGLSWVLGFLLFGAASPAFHVLVILAVTGAVVHFARDRRLLI